MRWCCGHAVDNHDSHVTWIICPSGSSRIQTQPCLVNETTPNRYSIRSSTALLWYTTMSRASNRHVIHLPPNSSALVGADKSASQTGHLAQKTQTHVFHTRRWHIRLSGTTTMTMTHSDKVSQRPGPTGMSEGVMAPRKKNLLRLSCLALLARCATGTQSSTVCSHKKMGTENTQAVAETDSNEFGRQGESSDSIKSNTTSTLNKRKEKCGRLLCSSVHPS